jgi:hypothetical protein
MTEINERAVNVLKAQVYDKRHEKAILELRAENIQEAIELDLARIDRIQTGDNNE